MGVLYIRYISLCRTGSLEKTKRQKTTIGDFFEDVDNDLRHLEREIERSNRVLTSIFERPEHSLSDDDLMMRHLLKIQIHNQRRQLRQLHRRADEFRKSLSSVLMHKSALISRFVNTLVQEVRNVFTDLNQHVSYWIQEALTPLFHQNDYQKQLLEHHMLRLTQLQGEQTSYKEQLQSLEANIVQQQTALSALEPLYRELLDGPLNPEWMVETATPKANSWVVPIQAAQAVRQQR